MAFHTDWGRGPGIHHANTEYYVLEGEMTYGDGGMGKGGYVYAPRGSRPTALRFREGSRSCTTASTATPASTRSTRSPPPRWADAREDVIAIDTEAVQFDAVPNPGPMPGLFIKYLHVDPVTGFYTRLVHAAAGWTDHRLAHHPCYEEAYTVQGHMEYNFGTLDLGTYFFRPARVKHGHFTTMEGGATWLLRSDGELLNWYTQNEWVRWGGEAVNYGPDGTRMRWSQSTHDLGRGPTWRSDSDVSELVASAQWQRDQGGIDPGYVAHGQGTDHSLVAIAKALDAANLQGGHSGAEHSHEAGHDHDHSHDHGTGDVHVAGEEGHVHYGAVDPAQPPGATGCDPRSSSTRTSAPTIAATTGVRAACWTPGDPYPAPILSSLPVRSRSRGRWDADGM